MKMYSERDVMKMIDKAERTGILKVEDLDDYDEHKHSEIKEVIEIVAESLRMNGHDIEVYEVPKCGFGLGTITIIRIK